MMQITEDVFKIEAFGNVYLILKPTPFVIDSSAPNYKEEIKKEISKIIPLSKIKGVLLTHLHYDHAGNIDLFKNALIYASQREINDFLKNPSDFFFGHDYKKTLRLIKDAKPLPKEIFGLKVINVMGHTRGSVAFLDEQRHLLFSGDTLFYDGFGRIDLPTSVPEKMHDSVMLLKDLIKEKHLDLMPGHG